MIGKRIIPKRNTTESLRSKAKTVAKVGGAVAAGAAVGYAIGKRRDIGQRLARHAAKSYGQAKLLHHVGRMNATGGKGTNPARGKILMGKANRHATPAIKMGHLGRRISGLR